MNVQIFKNYTHQGLCRAIDVFNFPDYYPTLTIILSYRFLLRYRDRDTRLAPSKINIINSIKKMAIKYNNDQSIPFELVDILLEFSKIDGNELLNTLRMSKVRANLTPPKSNGPKGTIYADSQSVHNSSITKQVKDVIKYICAKHKPNIVNKDLYKKEIRNKLEQNKIFVRSGNVLDEVLNRIYADNSKIEGFDADEVLFGIWNWIVQQNNDEIYNRISEEIYEMHRYCSTRIITGLVNSIQGFTDDENMIIKMSTNEQTKSVVYSYLDRKLKDCKDDKVIDGMFDKSVEFLDFVRDCISRKQEEWLKDYGNDFITQMSTHVNNYTQINIL